MNKWTSPDWSITKREWYAGMALQGLLANHHGWLLNAFKTFSSDQVPYVVANMAFRYADAMLVESQAPTEEKK